MILSYKDKQNKRKTKSISTHLPVKGNKKKAEAMFAKARKEFIPTLWDKDTDFSTFLSDWIELANFSPDTYADYYMCLNTYIVPYFDTVERSISSITVNDLDTFYKELQKNASIPTSESLKATISLCHTIIKNGLLYAVKARWIESNPADKLNPSTGEVEILFSDFILDWLEMIKSSVDFNTYAGYLSSAKSSIVPYFNEKGYTLKDLEENPKFIQDYYSYEMNVVGLTSNTVIHRHANIRKCLQYAFQVGLIKSNPADRVERPQKNVFVSEYYDTQELDDLFRAVKGDPIELSVILAAFYGMRRSEIVGLKWNCIDFDKKTISIQHIVTDIYLDGHLVTIEKDKTKTKSSTRTLPLVKPFEDALIALKGAAETTTEALR
jgi:site-specific recombinase XerD